MLEFFPDKQLVPEHFKSRQFDTLWQQYRRRMLDKAWCGMFEAFELAKWYNKSIVIWKKKTPSTISIIERCILPGAQVILFLPALICPPKDLFFSCKPAQDDIVHLLYVNNMHFESTNLPPNFLPLVPDPAGTIPPTHSPSTSLIHLTPQILLLPSCLQPEFPPLPIRPRLRPPIHAISPCIPQPFSAIRPCFKK